MTTVLAQFNDYVFRRAGWRIGGRPAAWFGALGLALVLFVAIFAPELTHSLPLDMVAQPYQWPDFHSADVLGTDTLGRDLWSGIAWGARVSMRIGLEAGLAGAAVGLLAGCVAGYCGGWIDNAIMRVAELFQVMPSLLFTLVLVIILQSAVGSIVLGIAATSWPGVARLARGEARRLRHAEFVEAAFVMGMRGWRIVAVHIVPNALMPVVAMLPVLVGHAILVEAAISFLGLGDPNIVSWGSMIGQGRDQLRTAWYMSAEPGVAIVFLVICLGLVGRALNDWINPRAGTLR